MFIWRMKNERKQSREKPISNPTLQSSFRKFTTLYPRYDMTLPPLRAYTYVYTCKGMSAANLTGDLPRVSGGATLTVATFVQKSDSLGPSRHRQPPLPDADNQPISGPQPQKNTCHSPRIQDINPASKQFT